jgi:hypothetical protein
MTRYIVFFPLPLTLLFAATEAKLEYSSGAGLAKPSLNQPADARTTTVVVDYAYEAPAGLAPAATRDPAKHVGLILCFPEHDRPTGDEIYPVRESLRRQGLLDQYVIIGIHPQAQKFGDADHEPIRQVIGWARKQYPINPRRIYMYGKGEGAKISGEFGTQNATLITAAVTYSWGWWKIPADSVQPPDKAPSYYTVLGMRDLLTHIQTVRDTYTRMNAKGYDMIYREFEELGARTYHPVSNDEGLGWALKHRNKNISPTPEEQALLLKANQSPSYFKNVALVGGPEASMHVLMGLTRSHDAKVRAAAANACAEMICDESAIAALAGALVDDDEQVRANTLHTLAVNANWRSPYAQKILIDYVKAPKDPLMRKGAIDALAFAIRHQVTGVRQDPHIFATFIDLLQDQDEEARTMAANVLAPIRDKEFRGDLGRKENKEPEGGWTKWLAEITAKQAGYNQDYAQCTGAFVEPAQKVFCEGQGKPRPLAVQQSHGGKKTVVMDLRRQPNNFQKTKEAAEMGYAPAQAMLGMMYANGTGVAQDYKQAAVWWQKAADQGHALAAQNLARVPGRRPAQQSPPPAPVK